MTFEKEVAEKVILPKLREVYLAANKAGAPIKNKADFRKRFMEHEGITLSAAKFDEYLCELNIVFRKVLVIEGLEPRRIKDDPTPARPSGRAVDGEEVTGEEVSFDNEDTEDFPEGYRAVKNADMFNQL